ncbi:LysR family transcriptional regulator [Gilvimarinus algae]|uniref:LysR family transcriptional regulator n=1 Tax=Gilvimarinus algae TaxID=3058037 RepID=A0ABT8TKY6_9GAMM|nr:LysR family transcriptional regulator [Gilvimarinus sp. SDUM040014]MDO3384144.1 LysR family transcriptional regulator [Gilvimarinus sp. SDUM040014]
MDSLQLSTFIIIAETGSFSAAAERLHLTQPAVSKRMALLEEQLGTRLFDRLGKHISLSQAGRVLLPRARAIVQAIGEAERAIGDLSGTVSGRLSIATSHHIGLHRLPPVLGQFSRAHPEVSLDLHFLDSEKALEAVERGDFDLGVITLPDERPKALQALPIWRDELCFVAAPSHPLAGSAKSLKDLTTFQAILPDAGTYTTRLIQQLFEAERLPLTINMVTNHLDTIKMMVSVGLGWGVLPEPMVDDSLTRLDLEIDTLERSLGAVYHRGRSQSNASKMFLHTLTQSSLAGR